MTPDFPPVGRHVQDPLFPTPLAGDAHDPRSPSCLWPCTRPLDPCPVSRHIQDPQISHLLVGMYMTPDPHPVGGGHV